MSKKSKIRASAKGEDCQVRVEGVCNFNPETTILAHLGGTDNDWDVSDAYTIAFKEGSIQYKVGPSMTNLEFDIKIKGYQH